jgi:DeoR/GlpR family transcriptional regulator of sugar metabolism
MLNISESTARRMLVNLEQKGLVIRTFGGIQKLALNQHTYSYTKLEQEMIDEKQRIGQFAASFVYDNDVIFISGGTTLLQMSIALDLKLRSKEINNITVLTSSLVNVEVLGNSCKVILTGGEYRPERRDFAGFMAEKLIRTVSLNKCFLGVDGINVQDGLMSYDSETARIDELVISRSSFATVLCDSSKFLKTGFITLAPIHRVKSIITDNGISALSKTEYESLGINVHAV